MIKFLVFFGSWFVPQAYPVIHKYSKSFFQFPSSITSLPFNVWPVSSGFSVLSYLNYFDNEKNQKSWRFGVNPRDTWIELFESNIFSQQNHFPICYNIVSYHVYCRLKMKFLRVSERVENSFSKVYTIILIHSIESNWSVFDGVEKFQSAFVTWPLKKNMKVWVVPFRRGNIRCWTGLTRIKIFYLLNN